MDADRIREYFQYHPVVSEARKAKHELVNQVTMELAIGLMVVTAPRLTAIQILVDAAESKLEGVCQDEMALRWATKANSDAIYAASRGDHEGVLMHVQQMRMFLNQGITVDAVFRNEPFNPPA
jgi:hypothetical protein